MATEAQAGVKQTQKELSTENSKMLEMMNQVLDDREAKHKKAKHFKRKRDEKLQGKQGMANGDAPHQKHDDDRPLVDQLFKPSEKAYKGDTKVVAIDCEMVEVDRWGEGLARVSIVNYHGQVLMDKYVIPEGDEITNYRTWVSGITPEKLDPEKGAIKFQEAKKEAHRLLKDKVIVGHSLKHDFQVLELPETLRPKENVRDLTSYKKYQAFNEALLQINGEKKAMAGKPCGAKSLKRLSKDFLGVTI